MTFKVVPDGTIDWSPEKKSLFYGIIKVESGLLRADSDVRKGKESPYLRSFRCPASHLQPALCFVLQNKLKLDVNVFVCVGKLVPDCYMQISESGWIMGEVGDEA